MDEIISSVKSDLETAFETAFERESFSELDLQIADFGLTIFGIIDLSGQPLIIKSYANTNQENESERSSLFAGFIAALSNFAKEEFSGKIQDFAINNQRIFFKFAGSVIFIASVREVNISNLKIQDFYVFSENIFELIAEKFLEEYNIVSKDFEGLSPWLDEFEIRLGEYLCESIKKINIPF
jgi:hypothetical protein